MRLLHPPKTSLVSLTLLMTLATAPLIALRLVEPALAQSSALPVPTSVPVATTIQIDGSSSMATINRALKQRFEQQFVGTSVDISDRPTDAALQDVLAGKVDLAAIGRALTTQEKAQGLMAVPVTRQKIAIIVGTNNPFQGSLTLDQFAKIFRGEIKDWSQVGGAPGPIRVVDRPAKSDIRQAFRNYTVFQTAPFKTGVTARPVASDRTDQVIQALGTDGIGYAIADQLQGRGDVRAVPLHNTLPSNPKYPFSQPLVYVYKGPTPNPDAQAFLGFATAPNNQQAIEDARQTQATATVAAETTANTPTPTTITPTASTSPTPGTNTNAAITTPAPGNGRQWLWLLAIPLIGGLLWWLLRDRQRQSTVDVERSGGAVSPAPTAAATVPLIATGATAAIDPAVGGPSRLTLTPHDCRNAQATWEVPPATIAALKQQGAQKLILRLYDVTAIEAQQEPHSLQEFDCDESIPERPVPIRTDDRTYRAELGYVGNDGRWLSVAQSDPVHVPACEPDAAAATTASPTNISTIAPPADALAASVGGTGLAAGTPAAPVSEPVSSPADDHTAPAPSTPDSRIILVPRTATAAYVYWEVPQAAKDAVKQQGGQTLALRVYPATEADGTNGAVQQFICSESDQDRHVHLPASDRDYVAEVGYTTREGGWLSLARSPHVRVTP